jgi:hypothetical protein
MMTYVTGMKARYIGAAPITMAPEGLILHLVVSGSSTEQVMDTRTLHSQRQYAWLVGPYRQPF